jgi:hypothetical protein
LREGVVAEISGKADCGGACAETNECAPIHCFLLGSPKSVF